MHLERLDITARPIVFDPKGYYLGRIDGILVVGKIVEDVDKATGQVCHNISPVPEREPDNQKTLVRILPYVEQMDEVHKIILDDE